MAVTDRAIEGIKQMIISGRVRPGDRLPPEAELGEVLGLSRSSLREAVRALSLMNVLDVRQGDGTYVTSLTPALLLDALSFTLDLQHDDSILQFLEVRRILEPVATAMAATRLTDAEIAGLGDLLDELDNDSGVEELVANDQEFHRRIVAGCHNDVLASLVERLSGQTHRARVWRGLTEEGAVARTRDEHRSIQRALAQREPDLAHAWASVHIAGVEDWLRRALVEKPAYGSATP